jgi:hypothetical protein
MLRVVSFAVVPLLIFALVLSDSTGAAFAVDFHRQYWPVGVRVLHGLSPYDLGWQDVYHEIAFPYGPVAALLFVPFGLLPHGFADVLFTCLCIGAVPLTLWLSGVRDWRVHGVVFLWTPVIAGWTSANVTLLLGLGIALMWRFRDRAWVAGFIVALLVSVKLFVWPLALWLLATRRYVALAYAVLSGLALNLVAWAIIGFDQVGPFIELLGLVTDRMEPHSDSVLAIALDHGASRPAAYALTCALATIAGCSCFVLARRGREAAGLLLCIIVCFLATPVIWLHYFALLIVPIALLRPRLAIEWLLPVAMLPVWALTSVVDEGVAGELVVIAAVLAACLRPLSAASAAPRPQPA